MEALYFDELSMREYSKIIPFKDFDLGLHIYYFVHIQVVNYNFY